jgi:hypothetical protein
MPMSAQGKSGSADAEAQLRLVTTTSSSSHMTTLPWSGTFLVAA